MALYTKEVLNRAYELHVDKWRGPTVVLKEEIAKSESRLTFDIFLSHSYLDAKHVLALKRDMEQMGFGVYVDWIEDRDLNRDSVTPETARRIRVRMGRCSCLLFAASTNSPSSKWMPWELGLADGSKGKVAIVPVVESGATNTFRGQEYLGLYPYVTKDRTQGGYMTLWIRTDELTYVSLRSWLKGSELRRH